MAANYTDTAAESAVLGSAATAGQEITVAEQAAVHGEAAGERVAVLLENARISGTAVVNSGHQALLTERAQVGDSVLTFFATLIRETATLGSSASIAATVVLADGARLSGIAAAQGHGTATAQSRARVADGADGRGAVVLTERATLGSAVAQQAGAGATIEEAAAVHGGAAVSGGSQAALRETGHMADALILTAQGNATLRDEAFIAGGLVVPRTGAAWAASTDTFAMSRYTGFPVNSVAAVDGRLVGFTDDGAFLLNGPDDDGREIDAAFDSGLIDVGMARIPVLYPCYKSDGVLGVTVGVIDDGQERRYSYSLPKYRANDPTPNRLTLGRGLKSRHWRFIVENDAGADFTLHDVRIPVNPTTRKF